jgi:hypothetical protein
MRFLIDIGHPAHVHLFKNFIKQMSDEGHEFLVTAREKEITFRLLEAYGIKYIPVGSMKKGFLNLIFEWIKRDIQVYRLAKEFRPDYILGTLNPTVGHVSKMLGVKSIIFTDYEPSAIRFPIAYYLTVPFVDIILVPDAVRHDYGKKSIKISTFKELAYLHPENFNPNPNFLDNVGIPKNERYAIIRFVSWGAHHDVSNSGFTLEEKKALISLLETRYNIYISSEVDLPDDLQKYQIPVKPDEIHSLLYYSSLFVCDSQTMATEAAILGVPTIRYNSFVGEKDMGNFIELQNKYGLIYNADSFNDAVLFIKKIINIKDIKNQWKIKKTKLLNDKKDLNIFFMKIIFTQRL